MQCDMNGKLYNYVSNAIQDEKIGIIILNWQIKFLI